MKKLILVLYLCVSSVVYSQSSFQKGSFIKNNGEHIECLIKNLDWVNTPNSIQYKLDKENKTQSIDTSTLLEFTINDVIKYKTINTKVDISKDKDINLSPITLFAQVLVEGKATLYSFKDSKDLKFFYAIDNSEVKELIKKEYYEGEEIKLNNDYLVQINKDLQCSENPEFKRIPFNKKDLKKHFIDYNLCKNEASVFIKQSRKSKFKLNVLAGINSSGFEIDFGFSSSATDGSLEYEQKISPVFGVEAEINMPFNNYKNSIIGGLTYRTYKGKPKNQISSLDMTMSYSSIEMGLGIRHYMFLNSDSKLFIDASIIADIVIDEEVNFSSSGNFDEFDTAPNIAIGFGYNYQQFGVALKYFTKRNLFQNSNDSNFDNSYKNISFLFLYNIL